MRKNEKKTHPHWSKTLEESESCLIGTIELFIQVVQKADKNTSPKITVEFNDHLENPVSSKTVRREQYKGGFHVRAAIRKLYQNKFVWNFQVFPLFCPTLVSSRVSNLDAMLLDMFSSLLYIIMNLVSQ